MSKNRPLVATVLRTGLLLCALAPFVVVAACGGDDSKKAKYPGKDAGPEPTGTEVTAGEGDAAAVVGVSDNSAGGISEEAKGAYDQGFKAWMSGDLNTAKQKFREATNADPKASAAYYSLGCVLERLGDNAGAQNAYRQAFSAKSDNEIAMGAYALNLAHTGHQSEADSFLTQKHQQRPKSARLETYLAEVKSLEKDSADAQRLAQDALRLDPNYKDAMVVIARDHYRAGRLDLAKYAITAILDGFGQASPARDPGNAEALLLRGLIEREEGRRIAAMKDFDAARTRRPDLIEATIQVAAMKLEAGNAAEAHPLLETAVKYAPENAIAHMNLGDCLRLEQRYADAKGELEKSLRLDSTLLGAHYALGLMYLNAPSFPGMDPKSQVAAAIRELEQYKSMRGTKAPPGTSDDIDDLIARAKDKQNTLNMPAATAAPPPKPKTKKKP
jgi:tetratricopeptide (TPR) repeat protein